MQNRTTDANATPQNAPQGADAEIFSPEELKDIRAFYYQRLSDSERRILHAFEGPLQENAPDEARLAAFAELRRSDRLRDYIEAAEACRLADKACALGVVVAQRAGASSSGEAGAF